MLYQCSSYYIDPKSETVTDAIYQVKNARLISVAFRPNLVTWDTSASSSTHDLFKS